MPLRGSIVVAAPESASRALAVAWDRLERMAVALLGSLAPARRHRARAEAAGVEVVQVSSLELAQAQRELLEHWSREAAPHEACGLLIGTNDGDCARVERVLLARNVAQQPGHAFEVHPEDHLSAHREAETLGFGVIGAWHSHPNGPAELSRVDCEHAEENWVHVVVSTTPYGAEMRAWRCSID